MDLPVISDTICAIATPPGEGGIGIIRISGPEAFKICQALFHPRRPSLQPESHRLYYGLIREPHTRAVVDEVLVSRMSAPHTYTREDVVEINCHSGYAVLQRILELVLSEGARLAHPGEFTRRAFLNGRLDLCQAEAVMEIIHSRCQRSLELATRHLKGDLGNLVRQWRDEILQLEAELEAHMDFSEDLQEGEGEDTQWEAMLQDRLMGPVWDLLQQYERGRLVREGLTLVLTGKPNAGKSSLLNALLRQERAIVTPFPGTTRDVIEASFILAGVRVRILDTAGIHAGGETIERLGIEKSLQTIQEAHVVLWLMDRSLPLDSQDDLIFQSIGSKPCLILLNKSDLPSRISTPEVMERYHPALPILELSALDIQDVNRLRELISQEFLHKPLEGFQSLAAPNLRQSECLQATFEALEHALSLWRSQGFDELISLELTTARRKLEEILGQESGEDVLERIFSQFCIGK